MMPQPQKPQPQLNQQTTKELNLTVLQRMDAAVEDILATAGHVTIYEFDVNEQTWSRKDVEGALFVVKRREQPRFQFVVMNRRSQDNLVEDLLADFEFELRPPYLLYRNALQEVNGIWFYNPHECEEIAKLFTRILNAFSKAPPKAKLFSAPASAEFQELEAVPTAATVEGPLEPAAAPPIATMAEEPLERFFSGALQLSASGEEPHPVLVTAGVQLSMPALASPNPPPALSSAPSAPPMDLSDLGSGPALLKPSYFLPPPLPAPSAPHPPLSAPPGTAPLQPHGAPLLQPFPPPAPPLSLAPPTPTPAPSPSPSPSPGSIALSKEGVRSAMFRLLQDDRFIDFVYKELLLAHSVHQ